MNAMSGSSRLRDALAILFAMSFPTFLAWLVFVVLPTSADRNNPWLQAAFGAGKTIQFLFPFVYLAIFERDQLRPGPPNLRGLGIGIAFGLAVGLTAFALYFGVLRGSELFAETTAKVRHWMTQFDLPSTEGFLLLAGFVALIHSLWEEYYWRWFVFGRMRRWLPWQLAAVLSGLGFMSHHVIVLWYYLPGYFWVGVAPFSFCVAVGGVFWAWLYERTGSLYATWVSHGLVDMAIMVVGYDLLN